MSEPRRLLQEALRRDASLRHAWILLSLTYLHNLRFSPTHAQDLLQANEAAERAMALDPRSWGAHLVMGWVRYQQKRIDAALIEFEHAIQLNPNEGFGYAFIAQAYVALGRAENALEPMRKAMRLNPWDPTLPRWQMLQGVVYLHLQRDVEALDSLKKAVALNPRDLYIRLFLASALNLSGREAKARLELAELLRLQPGFTLGHFKAVEQWDRRFWRSDSGFTTAPQRILRLAQSSTACRKDSGLVLPGSKIHPPSVPWLPPRSSRNSLKSKSAFPRRRNKFAVLEASSPSFRLYSESLLSQR
jgi:adenylate cyclase